MYVLVNCVCMLCELYFFFFFKQKTAYEMRISDWSSDVCSSDLQAAEARRSGHTDAGDDFDGPHGQHRLVGGARNQVVDPGREIVLPVGEQSRELVEAEGYRRNGADGAQQHEGVICGA